MINRLTDSTGDVYTITLADQSSDLIGDADSNKVRFSATFITGDLELAVSTYRFYEVSKVIGLLDNEYS